MACRGLTHDASYANPACETRMFDVEPAAPGAEGHGGAPGIDPQRRRQGGAGGGEGGRGSEGGRGRAVREGGGGR